MRTVSCRSRRSTCRRAISRPIRRSPSCPISSTPDASRPTESPRLHRGRQRGRRLQRDRRHRIGRAERFAAVLQPQQSRPIDRPRLRLVPPGSGFRDSDLAGIAALDVMHTLGAVNDSALTRATTAIAPMATTSCATRTVRVSSSSRSAPRSSRAPSTATRTTASIRRRRRGATSRPAGTPRTTSTWRRPGPRARARRRRSSASRHPRPAPRHLRP